MVRIHLPPADSLSSLPQSFSKVGEPGFSARVWAAGFDDQVCRDAQVFRYRARRQQYLFGPYSGTAVSLIWAARMPRRPEPNQAFSGLGVYGGMNENFVLVAGRSRWPADGV